ncbi:NF-kappa-B inhibitor beta [Platysternon megacephalum]|uniref:NF-kappa-B inhibitor beta n=1 Tax=Platysternon megacephalum TaxID=55544 RepID=A0A4D9DRN4_9SAUR|nr:NF-kappa-B inhibitor beta [Platysternon megacephalum]
MLVSEGMSASESRCVCVHTSISRCVCVHTSISRCVCAHKCQPPCVGGSLLQNQLLGLLQCGWGLLSGISVFPSSHGSGDRVHCEHGHGVRVFAWAHVCRNMHV